MTNTPPEVMDFDNENEEIEARHVTKYTHADGVELTNPLAWCGNSIQWYEFHFLDAQHVALSSGGSVQPCKFCVKAIVDALLVELD